MGGGALIHQTNSIVPRMVEPEREQSDNNATSVEFNKIADRIYEVETRKGTDLSGKHGRCVAQGKANGYSYAPGVCYSSDEEARKIVIDWLKRKTQNMTIQEALCLYGGAGKVQTCEYANKFKKI